MSSKVKRMPQQMPAPVQQNIPSHEELFRVNVSIPDGEKSAYILIAGVPDELPPEATKSVEKTAEQFFAQKLQQNIFLELYPLGEDSKTTKPTFYNLTKLDFIKVTSIEKVEVESK